MSRKPMCTITLCLLLRFTLADASPSEELDQVMQELSPKVTSKAINTDPRWRKVSKIHVMVPSFYQQAASDGFESWLESEIKADVVLLESEDELKAVQNEVQALVGWCSYLNGEFPKLVWIQNLSAGVEGCTKHKQFHNKRVIVSNGAATHGPAIAEWVIGSMFLLQRNSLQYYQQQRKNNWIQDPQTIPLGAEINNKTILIVGLGGIGKQIAWRAKGLGMRVTATRNSSREGPDYVDYVGLADELSELAKQADVVVNAAPLTEKTKDLFNRSFFQNMKPDAKFINVGRGGSVVQSDLIAALKEGEIGGAALDVTTPEPLPKNSELWGLPNVYITPHHSSLTGEARNRFWLFMRENIRRLVAGKNIYNLVNLDKGY